MKATVQGTEDSAANQKENPALVEEGDWVPREAAAETQLGGRGVHVWVGVEVCGAMPMEGRGGKQTRVRKL